MDFLQPTENGYDDERTGYQLASPHMPDLIAPVAGVDDVRQAVYRARDEDMDVAVQATGHGLRAPLDGGMLISTRRMNQVKISGGIARVEAGATWTPVIAAAAGDGLAPLSGSTPHVGAVGYTLAGGMSLMARRYGYAADHVIAIEVVTPDGDFLRVEPGHELFWALRGGRDRFGIVTAIEVELVPVSRIYGGVLVYDYDQAAEVVAAWRALTEVAPEDLTSSIALVPPAGVVSVRIGHVGDGGDALIEPLRALGPSIDTVADMPYIESHTIYNDSTEPTAFYGANVLVDDFDFSDAKCIVEIRHMQGALAREPEVPSAVPRSDARYSVSLVARAPAQDEFDRILGGLDGRGYALNFLGRDQDVRAAYDDETWERLNRVSLAV